MWLKNWFDTGNHIKHIWIHHHGTMGRQGLDLRRVALNHSHFPNHGSVIELDAVGRQFEPYLTTGCVCTAAPLWCSLGCQSLNICGLIKLLRSQPWYLIKICLILRWVSNVINQCCKLYYINSAYVIFEVHITNSGVHCGWSRNISSSWTNHTGLGIFITQIPEAWVWVGLSDDSDVTSHRRWHHYMIYRVLSPGP